MHFVPKKSNPIIMLWVSLIEYQNSKTGLAEFDPKKRKEEDVVAVNLTHILYSLTRTYLEERPP